MSIRQFPTTGTAGGLHHERESFRSGWPKARELLARKVYQGEIPEEDLILLTQWYTIRNRFFGGDADREKFDEEKNEFNKKIPNEAPDKLINAIKLITGYLSENNGARG